ncbi:MAG: response regulator, partial [Planctomycetota bacterium]
SRLKEEMGADCPDLVMLTSSAKKGDAREFKDAGFAGYFVKPIRMWCLLEGLAMLHSARLEGSKCPMVTRHSVAEARAQRGEPRRPVHRGDEDVPKRFRGHVLLVEDNAVNQEVQRSLLERVGLIVDVAADGQQACDKVETNDYDLVLMDCQMPVMSGFEATEEIRRREEGGDERLPIVALTARVMEGDRERCSEAGMDGFVSKPIDPVSLRQVLAQWLEADSAAEAAMAEVEDEGEFAEELAGEDPAEAGDDGAAEDDDGPPIFGEGGLEAMFKDPAAIQRLLGIYRTESPKLQTRIEAAIECGDGAELCEAAHSLKGSLKYLSARPAAELAFALETMGRNSELDGAPESWKQLQHELSRLHKALDSKYGPAES